MNWEQIEGKWKQYSGRVREKWGNLTDSDLQVIAGRRDQLIGKIQERYGIAKEEAQRQVDDFFKNFQDDATASGKTSASGEQHDHEKEKARGAGRS